MINDILEMSRLDAGRTDMNIEIIDLGDIAGMVETVVQPLADKSRVAFACDIDPDVPLIEADFEKVRHVLENLCGNAVKFTPEGGSVTLRMVHHPECGECGSRCRIRASASQRPTGSAYSSASCRRDSSPSRKYNGTGLGLSLAKEYTEMHGGALSVESEPGMGSTFTVRIPVERTGER